MSQDPFNWVKSQSLRMSSDIVFLSSITPGITQNEWVHLEMPKNNETCLHF